MTDDALQTWRDKLAFLRQEEALAVEADRKFALAKLIEEALRKIEELERPPRSHTLEHRPNYADEETERLSVALEGLFERREQLASADQATREIDREILDVRRLLRKGPQLQPGEILADGRFKLVDVLGQGGFATVWKAYDRQLRQLVAVKVLHGQHSHDRTKRERFFRGARRMAELSHPHIVRVIEKEVEDEGWLFFVMELVAGGDLRHAVLDGVLSTEEKIDIVLQVGEALAYAHERGIVHRDVKPANVLLEQQNDKWSAKVTDFDLVRVEGSTGFTATRAMMGTLQFAAPESLVAARDVGPPADVYSLGSTTVFALHGAALPGDYYRNPRHSVTALEVSEALRRVLGRAVAVDAAARFASMGELCRALKEATRSTAEAASEASQAQPVVREQVTRPELPVAMRRTGHRAWVLGAVALALWGLGVLGPGLFVGESGFSKPGTQGIMTGVDLVDVAEVEQILQAVDSETQGAATTVDPADVEQALQAGESWQDPKTGMRLRYIPGGHFQMGSPWGEKERSYGETQHDVELTRGFWMGETEVTQGQWRELMGNNPSYFSSCGDGCPVEKVSWWDAATFADRLSEKAGLDRCYALSGCQGTPGEEGYACTDVAWQKLDCEGYRLPTEAEWEYAARAGSQTPFWTGENLTTEQANYDGRHPYAGNVEGVYRGETVQVQSLAKNPWGLYEVHGNVEEWVWDRLGTYPSELVRNPVGPDVGALRIIRGGSWVGDARDGRAAYRSGTQPGGRYRNLGFRLSRGTTSKDGAQLGAEGARHAQGLKP